MLPVISWLHTTSVLQWTLWEQPPGMNIFWISIKSMAIHWMMVRMLSSETPYHQRLKRTCPHHQFSDFSSSRSGLSSLLSCFSNHHEVDIVFPQGGTRCRSGSVCCRLLIFMSEDSHERCGKCLGVQHDGTSNCIHSDHFRMKALGLLLFSGRR